MKLLTSGEFEMIIFGSTIIVIVITLAV